MLTSLNVERYASSGANCKPLVTFCHFLSPSPLARAKNHLHRTRTLSSVVVVHSECWRIFLSAFAHLSAPPLTVGMFVWRLELIPLNLKWCIVSHPSRRGQTIGGNPVSLDMVSELFGLIFEVVRVYSHCCKGSPGSSLVLFVVLWPAYRSANCCKYVGALHLCTIRETSSFYLVRVFTSSFPSLRNPACY